MAHTAQDPAFERLIDLHAPGRQIGSGFTFTEGPVWHPAEQALYFSDMPADVRRRWDRNGVREVMRPSNKANGLTLDAGLNLLACEHATSAVVRFRPDGRREVLTTHFEGRELNSPNDLCVHSSGAIYFTDPWYGRMPHYGVERPRQLGFQGVYRFAANHVPGAEPQLLVERYLFSQPNGRCFSPCERLLYVNDTEQANIRVFDVAEDGSLQQSQVFASGIRESLNPGLPDGMKCDAEGTVWVTGPGGLWVFRPDGKHIGRVAIPELAANLAWGGEDWCTLFVCASTSVYAVATKVGPRNEPHMRAAATRAPRASQPLRLDARRCALIIQDMQNDMVMEGGAFASTGAAQHCREQNAIANIARLAERCRALGIPVIHVWFVVPPGGKGMTLNAPLFEGVMDNNAMVRGSWGAARVPGLEPRSGDHVVEKNQMSAWEGTMRETILKARGRDIVIETGAWTNMSIEHTARTGADKGYIKVVPEDCCSTMNADWHRASINYALLYAAERRARHDDRRRHRSARLRRLLRSSPAAGPTPCCTDNQALPGSIGHDHTLLTPHCCLFPQGEDDGQTATDVNRPALSGCRPPPAIGARCAQALLIAPRGQGRTGIVENELERFFQVTQGACMPTGRRQPSRRAASRVSAGPRCAHGTTGESEVRAVRVKRRGIAVPGVARPGLKAGHRDTAPREDRGLVWPLLLLGTAGFSMAFEVKVTG